MGAIDSNLSQISVTILLFNTVLPVFIDDVTKYHYAIVCTKINKATKCLRINAIETINNELKPY